MGRTISQHVAEAKRLQVVWKVAESAQIAANESAARAKAAYEREMADLFALIQRQIDGK